MVGSFWVDDVALDGDDWFLTNATLLPSVASRRVSQLELFRGQGVRTAKGGWGLGSLTVDLVVPEGGTGSVSSRLRRLQALLAGSSEIRAELDGLPVMACEVVGVDVSDPSRVGIEVWSLQAKFTLQPFWVEGSHVNDGGAGAVTQALTGTGSLVFTQWAGSTGVVRDGILRVSGSATSVSVTASDGTGFTFPQPLTSSQSLFVDVEKFRAWVGAATDWNVTYSPAWLDWPPAGPLVLKPSSDGVRLTLNGGTGLALKGRRWWL